jgi:hypothetical protein
VKRSATGLLTLKKTTLKTTHRARTRGEKKERREIYSTNRSWFCGKRSEERSENRTEGKCGAESRIAEIRRRRSRTGKRRRWPGPCAKR